MFLFVIRSGELVLDVFMCGGFVISKIMLLVCFCKAKFYIQTNVINRIMKIIVSRI